jgi:hypothetical protein
MMSGCKKKEKLHFILPIMRNDKNYLRLGVEQVVVEGSELGCVVCMFAHHQQLHDG